MLRKNVLIGAAACAALVFAGMTRADVLASPDTSVIVNTSNVVYLDTPSTMAATMPMVPATAPAPASAPAATVTPLMSALDAIQIGHGLEALNISVTGYVEGSWTYSAHPPAGNLLGDRVFDTKTENLQFDGVDLAVVRNVDYTKKAFDVGFTLEQLYGWDGAYIHSNGLTIYSPSKTGAAGTAAIHPKAQYDLNQANFTVALPVGNGLGLEAGKFDTLLGYEVIDSPSNPFFSHSYIFDEEPFTHTGILGIYNLMDPSGTTTSTIIGGITRGWDQATKDNNGSIDYTAQYKITGPKGFFTLEGITGDESASGPQDGWRTVLDATASYNVSDQFTLGFNGMFGMQAQTSNGGFGGGTGKWYGAALYGKYACGDYLTFNVRGEWFDDEDGAAPTQLSTGLTNIPNQFYEVTVGLTYKPFPHDTILSGLAIRPEGRWDYSDHAAFNGGAQHDQWTGAIEAYYAF